jgi:branched-subunit amino acid aminotransferase/4-amino-4-deoxychorismate lyase
VLLELAAEQKIPCHNRDLAPDDVLAADEVFLTSTSPCIVPVVRFNGRAIGDGRPGPTFARFISAWSALVGVDIMAQAQKFAKRS